MWRHLLVCASFARVGSGTRGWSWRRDKVAILRVTISSTLLWFRWFAGKSRSLWDVCIGNLSLNAPKTWYSASRAVSCILLCAAGYDCDRRVAPFAVRSHIYCP